ncbi:MAG: TRAP transporter large permease subunit, partial [Phycisphaerae bacterium]
MTPFAWMCVVFVVLLLIRIPVAFAIAIAAFAGYAAVPDPFGSKTAYGLLTDMTGGVHKIALIAIPFFILAGRIMGSGGIARRLIALSNAIIGWVRGGTGYVNVLASMFFGGVSGSAVADVSSIGSILIPLMDEEGYDREFATAVTVSSSTIGLIIPPSNVMILYAVVAGGAGAAGAYRHVELGIGTMFLAGLLPGVVIGMALMLAVGVLSAMRGYPKGTWRGVGHAVRCVGRAVFALAVVAIILGGILFGFLTAADSAAVAVVVALAVGIFIYRELPIREVPGIFREAVVTTGVVFFLI